VNYHTHFLFVAGPNFPDGCDAIPSRSRRLSRAPRSGLLPARALLDALRPAGVQALDMPATPEKIWRALSRP
jgi:aerobic carbon-monoxide dehydrogenase large subunit